MADPLPSSRAEARRIGAPRFFTGDPCCRGHSGVRYTSTGGCIECQAERNHRRYWDNPTGGRESIRQWQAENPTATRVSKARAFRKRRGYPVPPWQSAEETVAIDAFYGNRPKGMAVDHIAALGHPEVVGLHTLRNLQYLGKSENSSKGVKLPEGLSSEEAVERGMAVWRRDTDVDGVFWELYEPAK